MRAARQLSAFLYLTFTEPAFKVIADLSKAGFWHALARWQSTHEPDRRTVIRELAKWYNAWRDLDPKRPAAVRKEAKRMIKNDRIGALYGRRR